MAEKGPEGSVGDEVEGFVEVNVEVEGGGVGEREGLEMVYVVECLVFGGEHHIGWGAGDVDWWRG